MSTGDGETFGFYARTAADYAARSARHVNRHLKPFLDRLPPGACILELGCGGGHDAQAMLAAGHAVDATDGVPEMAAMAQALLQRPVRVLRFEELDAVERYDAVWANACLLHVTRAALPQILARIRTALKPGGLLHATYKLGDAEGRDNFGRTFNYFSPAQLAQLHARSTGWELLGIEEYPDGSYHTTEVTPWAAVLARKASPGEVPGT